MCDYGPKRKKKSCEYVARRNTYGYLYGHPPSNSVNPFASQSTVTITLPTQQGKIPSPKPEEPGAVPLPEELELPTGTECVVCMAQPKNAVIKSCRHLSMCRGCAKATDKCPICRQDYTNDEIETVYVS